MNIHELKEEIAACRECSLRKRCRKVSVPAGNVGARIMVVGQAPGIEESQHGLTMIGQAGEFMLTHLEKLFPRKDIYVTNTVKCFPGRQKGGDGLPPLYAQEACRPFLESEIGFVDPQVIVAMGAFTARYFGVKGGIRQNSGKVFWNDEFNLPVIPVLHPAGLMRPKTKPEDVMSFVTSLHAIHRLLEGDLEEPEYTEDFTWAS